MYAKRTFGQWQVTKFLYLANAEPFLKMSKWSLTYYYHDSLHWNCVELQTYCWMIACSKLVESVPPLHCNIENKAFTVIRRKFRKGYFYINSIRSNKSIPIAPEVHTGDSQIIPCSYKTWYNFQGFAICSNSFSRFSPIR